MKKFPFKLACIVLAGGMLASSCIGSFKLTNKVLDWNREVTGSKFVNELVFIGLHIIPVYWVTCVADVLVLNSIEFWTGSNPVAGTTQTIKTDNGNLLVTATEDGYVITDENQDQCMELNYNSENKTWNVIADGESYEIMKMKEDGTVDLNLQNGNYMNVTLDAAGLTAARQAIIENTYFFAAR